MDPHRNLFFAYSGPLPREEDWVRRRQLEDNTTKALINVIELTGVGANAFIETFRPQLHLGIPSQPAVEVSLQRRPWFVQVAKHRRLVTITGHLADVPPSKQIQSGGRPDAWLYVPKTSLAIMIESKLGPKHDERQLRGHLQQAGWDQNTPMVHISWGQLHAAFKDISDDLKDSVDALLVRQFLGYLEVISLSPFNGFLPEDFDYFLTFPEDYGRIIKGRLEQFARLVHSQLPRGVRNRFPRFDPSPLRKGMPTGTSIRFRRAESKGDPFRHCNLTVEINQEGLTVNAVLRDGRFDFLNTAIGQVYSIVKHKRSQIIELLKGLGQGYQIRVYRRTDRSGHERILPGAEVWNPILTHRLGPLPLTFGDYLTELLESMKYPGIHVSRFISRGDSLLRNRDALVKEAVRSSIQLNSVLSFFESGNRGKDGRSI